MKPHQLHGDSSNAYEWNYLECRRPSTHCSHITRGIITSLTTCFENFCDKCGTIERAWRKFIILSPSSYMLLRNPEGILKYYLMNITLWMTYLGALKCGTQWHPSNASVGRMSRSQRFKKHRARPLFPVPWPCLPPLALTLLKVPI